MNNNEHYVTPAVYSKQTENGYKFTIESPGASKENVELHIDNRTLTLRTHIHQETPAGFHRAITEFDNENYAGAFELPELADLSTVKATIENGLLLVSVDKKPEVKPRKIEIA